MIVQAIGKFNNRAVGIHNLGDGKAMAIFNHIVADDPITWTNNAAQACIDNHVIDAGSAGIVAASS